MMKLKAIVAALAATTLASTAMAAEQTTTTTTAAMNAQVQPDTDLSNHIKTNTDFSQQMLSMQNVMNNQLKLLQDRQSGKIETGNVYIGGMGQLFAQWTLPNTGYSADLNFASPFIPSYHADILDLGSTTTVQLPWANLMFVSPIGDWVTGFAQLQVNNVISSEVVMPNAYFVVGDLNKVPVYFFGGKSVVNFGQFNQVTNYTPTLTRALFMQYGGNVGIGFDMAGLNLTASLMNGDGLAMMNAGASSAQQLNAFSLNGVYTFDLGNDNTAYVGVGYTNNTGFSGNGTQNITVTSGGADITNVANNAMVGAIDLNAGVNIAGLGLYGEFVMTTSGVNGLNASSAAATPTFFEGGGNGGTGAYGIGWNLLLPLMSFNSGAAVKAWSLQADYTFDVLGKAMVPYLSYSQVVQNTENQIVQAEIGMRYNIVDSVWIGGSYTYLTADSTITGPLNSTGKVNFPTTNVRRADATVYF